MWNKLSIAWQLTLLATKCMRCRVTASSSETILTVSAQEARSISRLCHAETWSVDVVVLEGWCVGVGPESEVALASPVNALEAEEVLFLCVHGGLRIDAVAN